MAVTTINLPTLYAQFSSEELGRTDLACILYDKDNVDVTSSVSLVIDAGIASGSNTLFPLHVNNLPVTTYVPGYLHAYFTLDSSIRPIDITDDLKSAILLALQTVPIQDSPNLTGYFNLIIQELGEQNDLPFQAWLLSVIGLWNSLYSANPFLVYQYAKRHAISYLLGNFWKNYDSKTGPVEVKLSQQFSNLIKLLAASEKELLYFVNLFNGFIQPTAGELFAVFPIEYLGSLYSPNSMIFRGIATNQTPNPYIIPS